MATKLSMIARLKSDAIVIDGLRTEKVRFEKMLEAMRNRNSELSLLISKSDADVINGLQARIAHLEKELNLQIIYKDDLAKACAKSNADAVEWKRRFDKLIDLICK